MVEVIYYETANKNKTIGYVDVRIPILKPTVMLLRRIAHVQSGDRRWFNIPTFTRQKPTGEEQYLRFYEFETQLYNGELMESLSEPVKRYCEEHQIKSVEPMGFDMPVPENINQELPF